MFNNAPGLALFQKMQECTNAVCKQTLLEHCVSARPETDPVKAGLAFLFCVPCSCVVFLAVAPGTL